MLKYLDNYISFISEKSFNTRKNYISAINDYFKVYSEITINNINNFIDTKKSYSSKNKIIVVIKDYYNFLYNNEYITQKINFNNIKHIKKINKLPVFLQDYEAIRFMDVVKQSNNKLDILAFSILINLGLRISELLNIKIKDIDFIESSLMIKDTKNNLERVLYFNLNIKELLKDYIVKNNLKHNDKLFSISDDTIQNRCKKYAKKANIRGKVITPHKLRHTCATTIMKNGGNILYVKETLGHSSIQTSEIYTHVDINTKKKIANMTNY